MSPTSPLLLLFALTACGDDSDLGEGGGGSTSANATTSTLSASSGTGGAEAGSSVVSSSSGSGAGGSASLPLVEIGVISVGRHTSDTEEGLVTGASASAYFTSTPDPTLAPFAGGFGFPSAWCDTETAGSCVVFSCMNGDEDRFSGVDAASAGTLRIDGLPSPIVLEPTDDAYGSLQLQPSDVEWTGGDPIAFVADGGEVPAFSIDLVAPDRAALETDFSSGDLLDTGDDLELAWSADGSTGRVQVVLAGGDAETLYVEVVCDSDVGDERLTVPTSALSRLPSGDVLLIFGSRETDQVTSGEFTVRAEVYDWLFTGLIVE